MRHLIIAITAALAFSVVACAADDEPTSTPNANDPPSDVVQNPLSQDPPSQDPPSTALSPDGGHCNEDKDCLPSLICMHPEGGLGTRGLLPAPSSPPPPTPAPSTGSGICQGKV